MVLVFQTFKEGIDDDVGLESKVINTWNGDVQEDEGVAVIAGNIVVFNKVLDALRLGTVEGDGDVREVSIVAVVDELTKNAVPSDGSFISTGRANFEGDGLADAALGEGRFELIVSQWAVILADGSNFLVGSVGLFTFDDSGGVLRGAEHVESGMTGSRGTDGIAVDGVDGDGTAVIIVVVVVDVDIVAGGSTASSSSDIGVLTRGLSNGVVRNLRSRRVGTGTVVALLLIWKGGRATPTV